MNEMINGVVGRRLQKIRKMLDVKPSEMAESLHISVGHYRKLERGDHAINLCTLVLLHEKYGIDLNYLITGRAREDDIARDLACGKPEEVFYFMHQLLDSCERAYMGHALEREEKEDKEYY